MACGPSFYLLLDGAAFLESRLHVDPGGNEGCLYLHRHVEVEPDLSLAPLQGLPVI